MHIHKSPRKTTHVCVCLTHEPTNTRHLVKNTICKKVLINISSIQKDNAEKEATQAEDKLATTLYTLQVNYIFYTERRKRMRILN